MQLDSGLLKSTLSLYTGRFPSNVMISSEELNSGRGGCMGRLGRVLLAILALVFIAASLTGCGGSSSSSSLPVPTSIRLNPTVASMDIGSTLQFTATGTGGGGRTITFTYQSSNPAVLTF